MSTKEAPNVRTIAAEEYEAVTDSDVIIIGTGFSGLGLATQLARRGSLSFTVLERAADVGGTWRDNTYPGAACDIQSHLYSYSFRPNPDWSRVYAPQPEILTDSIEDDDGVGEGIAGQGQERRHDQQRNFLVQHVEGSEDGQHVVKGGKRRGHAEP